MKIASLLLFLLVGCLSFADEPAKKYDYSAQAEIDGYTIHVGLLSNHPFLAEYRKILTISRAGKVIGAREFIDTGGFPALYVLREGDTVCVIHGGGPVGLLLNVATGEVTPAPRDKIPKDFREKNFGRFMFYDDPANGGKHTYKWFTAAEWPPK